MIGAATVVLLLCRSGLARGRPHRERMTKEKGITYEH